MKITDLNRQGGIGANCLLVQFGHFNLIVDCGLNPKISGRLAAPDFRPLQGLAIDLILITHCHLDHIGSLPLLMRACPDAPVVMTQPSRMLIERMLHNSASVMMREREEKGTPDYPLFTHDEIDRLKGRLHAHAFNHPKRFRGRLEEIEFTFHPAGHIVGAAGVEVTYKNRHVFFTGDVLFTVQRTLAGAMLPEKRFDTLVLETTRGATERAPGRERSREMVRLLETINTTLARGGSVLVPVFALGRMQEILAVLHDARKFNRLEDVPIYASGLGMDLCNYFDEIAKKTGQVHFTRTILKELHVRKTPRELKAGKEPPPGLYIVSSGMMVEHTPSYTLAASLAGSAKHAICFVGYCDPDTPGGQFLATPHGKEFLFAAANVRTKIRCQVERFELSGHADREELLDYAIQCHPKTLILTHGDPPARAWFAAQLAEKLPKTKVLDPVPLETYTV